MLFAPARKLRGASRRPRRELPSLERRWKFPQETSESRTVLVVGTKGNPGFEFFFSHLVARPQCS